jgi:hypothetical protein
VPDAGAERPPADRRSLRTRIIVWVVLAMVLVALAGLAASAVPRWWAQQMGSLSNGGLARSTWWGLAFGLVFTLLPTVVIAKTVRRWKGWKAPLVWLVVGVVLAAPNLFTLWIVVGTSRAAHAAERTLDVDAPYFAAATAWGALAGLLLGIGAELLWRSWRRRGKQLKQLKEGGPTPRKGRRPDA